MSAVTKPIKKLIKDPFGAPFKGDDAGVMSIMHLIGGTAIGATSGLSYLGSKYSEAMTPKMPAMPVQPAQEDPGPAVKAAAYSEADRLKKKKGLRSTILTGPAGITNPPTILKTKLG